MRPTGTASKLIACFQAFIRNKSGASAIEFAFIIPLLLTMYLGTMELGLGIEANKKVSRSAAMIGDLITQSSSLTKAEVDGILAVGESVMQPYNRTQPTIEITAIHLNKDKVVEVAWSRKIEKGVTSSGTSEVGDVPLEVDEKNPFLIKVEASLDYKPVLTWGKDGSARSDYTPFAKIAMKETYYLRPRQGSNIECTGGC